jgi:proline iminopeptidase
VLSSRERFLAFRRSLGHPPRLTRHRVHARGLEFAVWTSPAVPDALPLVCVNGGLLYDHKILWPALAPLAAHRQLVLYDQRGRGASQAPPGVRAARLEHDGGDLPAIREALGVERWDVLGHSWGGGIAMLGVVQDQEATRKLVLVDPVGAASEWLPTLHDAALAFLADANPAAHRALAALDPARLSEPDPEIHSTYARSYYPAWFADQELASLFVPPRTASLTGASVAARLRRDGYDWQERLRALSVPSLVIHGERDLLPPEQSRRTVRLLPHARLELVADAGHMPFWEAPERFFGLVNAFLGTTTHVPSPARPPLVSSPR